MTSLIRYFINRSFTVNVISLGVCLLGILGWFSLKRDLHPPFEFNNVQIQASLSGAAPMELEELVARPMEEALKGLPDVKKMTTTIQSGSVNIQLIYPADIKNMPERIENARSLMANLRIDLPEDLDPISITQEKVDQLFLAYYVLKNTDANDPIHRQWADRIETEIGKVPGISRVSVGLPSRNLYIRPDLKKLEKYDVAWPTILRAVEKHLGSTPLGSLSRNEKSYMLQIPHGPANIETLKKLPIISNRTGQGLRLGELANLEYRTVKQETLSLFDGEPGVGIEIMKSVSADAIKTSKNLEQTIAKLQSSLPAPMALEKNFSTTEFIQQQLNVLIGNGLQGLVLVLIVLMIFLDRKSAFMVAFGIPLSYAGSFLALWALGMDLDLISMIGLILVVGVLVDDAIIISERYIRLLEDGQSPTDAATNAARELIVPVTGTILTTIVAFMPIILIKSEMSIILLAIPVVIMSTLIVSWLETFFVLPNHLAHFIPNATQAPAKKFWDWSINIYEKVVQLMLKARYLVLPVYLGLLIFTMWFGSQKLSQNFQFGAGSEQVQVFADLKKSDSLAETKQALAPIFEITNSLKQEFKVNINTTIGNYWREGQSKTGYRFSKFTVSIALDTPGAKKARAEIKQRLETAIAKIDKDQFETILVEERKRGAEKQKESLVAVQLESSSGESLTQLKALVKKKLENQGAIKLLKDNEQENNSSDLNFIPDLDLLARHGLDLSSLAQNMQPYFRPYGIADRRDEQGNFGIKLEFADADQMGPEQVKEIEVLNQQNLLIPTRLLGKWETQSAPASFTREGGLRKMQLDFEFDEQQVALPEMKKKIDQELEALRVQFPSVKMMAGDADEWETENRAWAMRVVSLGLLLIFMVLVLDLQSLIAPFMIFSSITFSLVGIIWALYAHSMSVSIMVMIGIVGCAGVAVNDSIVMVARIHEFWKKGQSGQEGIVEGAKDRLRPIFLTWITTIVGVIPTAYGIGGEAGFTAPLAFAMLWGLLSAAVLNLALIPAMMAVSLDLKSLGQKILKSTGPNLKWKRHKLSQAN